MSDGNVESDVDGRRAPLRRVLALLEIDLRRVLWAVFLGALSLGSAVGLAAVSAWLIARASQMPPVLQLSVAVVAVRAFGISRGVFRYVERLASHEVALRGMAALRANLYQLLASGRVEAAMGLRRGELLSRVGADVDAVGDLVVRAWLPAAVTAVVSLGAVVLVSLILPWAGLALAVGLLLGGVVGPSLAAHAARRTEAQGAKARAAMTATCLEILENVGPLRVGRGLEGELASLSASDRELARAADAGAQTSGIAAALGMLGLGLSVMGSLLSGIPAVEAGTLAPVLLSITVLVPLAAFELLNVLPSAAVQLHRSREAALRIVDLLDAAGSGSGQNGSGPLEPAFERDLHGTPAESHAGGHPHPGLEAVQLACGWPGGGIALAEVSLALRPGRSIAIVGPSGVGKTTLLMTLAGLLPSRGGTLRVTGPSAGGHVDEPMGQALFLAEDAHVVATTVFENLRVARGDLTRDEALAALAQVGLSDWLAGLPDGLSTMLGPDGSSISGGERRRLLLARASLTRARFLLVDEPAEHLDPESADAVVRWLETLTRPEEGDGRGLLLATHRLSALERMDEVVMLGRDPADATAPARILARGTHRELLAASEAYRWALAQERAD